MVELYIIISSIYYTSTFFKVNSTVEFINNTADRGGAIFSYRSSVLFTAKLITVFNSNSADEGAAIFAYYGSIFLQKTPLLCLMTT